ncbi:aminotransferase class V-fold PLP-dependent enzyme [Bacillus salacetis]|uniref:Aminotransferase class V-fold PLP-dependent enzyme n=1 Tax=Bacillus salacetis TaxID=2315464 RepID=A0A3A1R9R1_9BACI|nr:aminotransferase class V-fold PLP-dependent enzyme [Bacillus salacetis]RIW38494.1 aminotransferase class V-fold PLP-dependent enzyme [Bacillus salacetis]
MNNDSLLYKIADTQEEFHQIHQMNYQTFVDEIPQHGANEEEMLIDRFHDENTYIIAKRGRTLVGMIAVRGKRPFSLDQKLHNVESFLPEGSVPCEIRLLSVKKEFRSSIIFFKLVEKAVTHCLDNGYNLALISGTVRQLKLYKRIGFEPFGPLVGESDARFQPMFLTRKRFESSSKAFNRLMMGRSRKREPVNFLPGPVPLHKSVVEAFSQSAVSHRSSEFLNQINEVKSRLLEMTGARHVQIIVGTGTLSNDLTAAQLRKAAGKGLILANGEFGYRLIDHANRMGLTFDVIAKNWDKEISIREVDEYLTIHEEITWVWTVHCETSTGYLFNLKSLGMVCKKHKVNLCVDACSSAGLESLDLQEVYLATTVSGKALGSYPGLAIVFHRESVEPDMSLPRYLDLGMYEQSKSVPYTHSSNLVSALLAALRKIDPTKNITLNKEVKKVLTREGIDFLGNDDYSSGIITLPLDEYISSRELGDNLKKREILISYESKYLLERNWVQLALMGEYELKEVMKAMDMIIEEYTNLRVKVEAVQ